MSGIEFPSQGEVEWRSGGVPYSKHFRDFYYSAHGGLEESRHVFLRGNGLPGRFTDGFRIAEIGFGTGLNLLAALDSWIANGIRGELNYTGFEAFPLPPGAMRRSLGAFPSIRPIAEELCSAWQSGSKKFRFCGIRAEVIIGDARSTLPCWRGHADAWFLDGFSPSKNPELWDPELLKWVARRTAAGGTCATYTSAGSVKRGLRQAGFSIERWPGFSIKRHMIHGELEGSAPRQASK